MRPKAITVIVVEDHLLTRLGLTMVLNADPAIEVVGEADNGVSALQLINEIEPDVAVVDIGLPQMDGIECTTRIKSSTCRSRILLRSSHQEDDAILAAIAAGADGYCLKDSSDNVLIEAIKTVTSGRAWLDARVALQIQAMFSPEGTLPKAYRQRALASIIKLDKEEIELLSRVPKAIESAIATANQGPDSEDADGNRPDHLRFIMKKIAEALALTS